MIIIVLLKTFGFWFLFLFQFGLLCFFICIFFLFYILGSKTVSCLIWKPAPLSFILLPAISDWKLEIITLDLAHATHSLFIFIIVWVGGCGCVGWHILLHYTTCKMFEMAHQRVAPTHTPTHSPTSDATPFYDFYLKPLERWPLNAECWKPNAFQPRFRWVPFSFLFLYFTPLPPLHSLFSSPGFRGGGGGRVECGVFGGVALPGDKQFAKEKS